MATKCWDSQIERPASPSGAKPDRKAVKPAHGANCLQWLSAAPGSALILRTPRCVLGRYLAFNCPTDSWVGLLDGLWNLRMLDGGRTD